MKGIVLSGGRGTRLRPLTDMYFYDNVRSLRPSARGEYETTDVDSVYLERDELKVEMLGRGLAWLDTGTADSLLQASQFFQVIEDRQGLKIACLEEIAWRMGLINETPLRALAAPLYDSGYGQYLLRLIEES